MSKTLLPPKQAWPQGGRKGDQRLSQTGNSDLGNECGVVHTLHLPGSGCPGTQAGAKLSPRQPRCATSRQMWRRDGSSTSHFAFYQLQAGLAAPFSAHQQPPASLPDPATVSFLTSFSTIRKEI